VLREKTGIGSGLLFAIIFSSLFGYGVIKSPYVAAEYMGSNGYLGFVLALLLVLAVVLCAVRLGQRFPGKSIIEYLPLVCGKILGKGLALIFTLFLLVVTAWAIRQIADLDNLYFLNRTPLWAIVLIILLTSFYITYKGIETITRLASFILPVAVVFIFLAAFFSFEGFRLDFIRPVFYTKGYQLPWGALQMFYCFTPLATLFMFYPYLIQKQKGFKIVCAALLLAGFAILLFVFSAIGTYGAKGVLRYSWPILELTRKANLPYVLQSFGLFFAVTYFSQIFLAIAGFYYSLSLATTQLFGVLNYKWFALLWFPVILFLVLAPPSILDIHFLLDYLQMGVFLIVFVLPLFIWLVATLLKRGETSDSH
jgi:spore germination protein